MRKVCAGVEIAISSRMRRRRNAPIRKSYIDDAYGHAGLCAPLRFNQQ